MAIRLIRVSTTTKDGGFGAEKIVVYIPSPFRRLFFINIWQYGLSINLSDQSYINRSLVHNVLFNNETIGTIYSSMGENMNEIPVKAYDF